MCHHFYVAERGMAVENETQRSELKDNVVAVAKVGGCMVSIAAIAFIFFVLILIWWMAHP
jgi:hypothetical protein